MASYKLTVGSISGIQLNVDNVTTKFSDKEFYVTMENLTYTKKIFAPSEIHTVLSVKAKDTSTTSFPKLSELQSTFSKKLVTLKDGDTTVCENFFVYRMKPSHGKASSASAAMKVELEIYSLDKLLTIDKYCNVFTAKQLGAEIFTEELKKFKLNGTAISGEVSLQLLNYTNKADNTIKEVRQPYLVQYNESFYDFMARCAIRCGEMLYFEGGKLHLGMPLDVTSSANKIGTDQIDKAEVEYEDCVENVISVGDRHYNYFNRTKDDDNRYSDSTFSLVGKFVSNEEPTVTGTKDDGKVTEETTINYENGTVTMTVITNYFTSKSEGEKSKLAGEIDSVVTTYVATGSDGEELMKETETVTYEYEYDKKNKQWKKDGDNYVFTTKKTSTAKKGESSSSLDNYHLPEANDALFEEVEKDGYTSTADEWAGWRMLLFQECFLNLMNSTSLYDFLMNIVESETTGWAHAASDAADKNNTNNETNLTLTKASNPDQTDDTTFNLFSTLKANMTPENLNVNKGGSIVSLLVSDFYSKIRSAATYVSQMRVRLNYSNTNPGLVLGDFIKVDGDYYVVINVEMDGTDHVVEAIPPFYEDYSSSTDGGTIQAAIPCPPLMPEIPIVRISEPQVAFVENNVDPNRLGRVRVRYPWQSKDGDTSPWVRMATPFATNGGGVTFKPCNGDEVLLNYEDGNIERPYIVGSLQSKYVTDFWGALDDRVIQSKNGHTIKFTDKDSGADFFLGWLPLFSIIKSYIPNADWLDFQEINDLTGGISIKDRYGLYTIDMSSDGRTVDIKSSLGNVNLSAFTGINISAPNGNITIQGKNVTIGASNKLTLESGSAVSDRFVKNPFTKESVCGALGDIADRTIGKLIDMTFIRTIVEVFTRPIDGTLKIKSNSYVLIEAGKGSAQIPTEDFRKPNSGSSIGQGFDTKEPDVLGTLSKTISVLQQKVNTIGDEFKTAYEEVKKAAADYSKTMAQNVDCYSKLTKYKLDGNDDIVSLIYGKRNDANFDITNIITKSIFDFDNNDFFKFEEVGDEIPQKPKPDPKLSLEDNEQMVQNWRILRTNHLQKVNHNTIARTGRELIVKNAQTLGAKLKVLFEKADAWSNFDFTPQEKIGTYSEAKLVTEIKKRDIFTDLMGKVSQGTVDVNKDLSNYKTEMTKLRRGIVYDLISLTKSEDGYKDFFSLKIGTTAPTDFSDDTKWAAFIDAIEEPSLTSSPKAMILGGLAHYFREKWLNDWVDATINRHKWKAPEKGRILLSDQPGRTLHFDSDVLAVDHNHESVTTAHIIKLKSVVNSVQ